MKRGFFIFGFALILLTISGVFAESVLSDDLNNFVKKIAEKKGISEAEIKNVSRVDFNELPDEINLKNIDDNSLGLYKVESENDSVFVITVSKETFEKINSQSYSRAFLNFGLSGGNSSVFMETILGSGINNGYVMMREGSITGISTNLYAEENGDIEIIIYKNNNPVGFRNVIPAVQGTNVDFDTQSEGLVTFQPGDVISTYIKTETGFKGASTLLEITTK
ncbi:MAG: hypothetical protein AABX28_01190 [Nanoarchaeota archaeon]